MKKVFLPFCALLFSIPFMAQTNVEGFVFEDHNKNNKMDRNEKGISNVAVTNGLDVVLTNKDGKYNLPINDDAIIAVIKPANYKVGVDENNLPQFFYNHKPNGSPKLKYKGVDPTGKLPKSVNFGLIPQQENDAFTALIFGDPQPYTQAEVDFFAKGIVTEVAGIKNVPFGLSLGDLVGNDLALFNPYIKAVKAAGIPWYNLLGNHDLNFDATSNEMADETYEAHFGPANYTFNYGKVHFIILDNVLYPDPRNQKGYWGGFTANQLQFIENDLKLVPKDHLIVLAFHIPLSETEGDSFRDADRDQLFRLLKDFPNTLSLSAHTHIQRQDYFGKKEGWLQEKPHHHYNVGTTSGDWYSGKLNQQGVPVSTMRDGTPKGYAFINFKGNQYNIDYKVAGKPKTYQMEVFAPKVIEKGRSTKSGIYVNFFMGSKNDSLHYRIDQGQWIALEYVEEIDPAYAIDVYEWDLIEELIPGRRSSNPIESKHLWRGKIQTNLEIGEHQVEIKAIDQFGKIHSGGTSYRLENKK
ncbi:calcineurin-like phosphoesterase C-terminal domain-containing protein [Flavobacterium xanthum]|uniref:Calcineurin-like phosphoesterase n=1 Tax=Flavobacterium xanthum TaxID=69322 RepID=A0A1M7K5W6_9FLAO|nr:calcineurin-like phosphoesterase family protein [Flavobacterium xanthum]SHM60689.1 Calcineurin-like phosphoesterase [Flavobacterium xanthum]